MTVRNRPLSPHLGIYHFPLLGLMSIAHRASGVALAIGSLLLVYWLGSAAYGPAAYARATAVLGSPIGMLVLFGFSVCLFYHLANGVRHLLWDIGWGFELPKAFFSGYVTLAVAAVLTVVTWIIGLSV
jgi:succinate dehydrogenase / fumarate reductase cytochrome b subunit